MATKKATSFLKDVKDNSAAVIVCVVAGVIILAVLIEYLSSGKGLLAQRHDNADADTGE